MSVLPGPSNAIVFAQYSIQGRWQRMLIIAGLYAGLMGGAICVSAVSSGDRYRTNAIQGFVGALTGFQVLILFVVGSFRVEAAVRNDVKSRMIESHRLMPAPPIGSILGYVFGAPLHALVLATTNFVMGAICCALSGLPTDMWILLNGVLLIFAVFVYALLVQFAFVAAGGFMVLLIGSVIAISAGNSDGLMLLPSLNVLLSPLLSSNSIFNQMFNTRRMNLNPEASFAYICSVGAMAIVFIVAVRTAVRRYLSSTMVGITPPLGLILLTVWVGLAAAQLFSPESFQLRSYRSYHQELVAETVIALLTAMLVAMLPIASAARGAWMLRRSNRCTKITIFDELFTVMIATAIIPLVLTAQPLRRFAREGARHDTTVPTTLVVFIFLLSVACIFSLGYINKRRAWIYAVLWVAVTWISPVIIDAMVRAMHDDNTDATWITTISPAGAMAMIWNRSGISVSNGIYAQLAMMILPAGLLVLAIGLRKRRASSL